MSNKIFNTIGLVTGSIILGAVIFYVALLAQQESAHWRKETAVQGCLLVSQEEYDYPETNSHVSVPNQKAFLDCMREKGY